MVVFFHVFFRACFDIFVYIFSYYQIETRVEEIQETQTM